MVANKLKLNDSKTEFVVAASAQNLRNLPNVQLNVGSTLISPSETIRNLGVIFDRRMSMSHHISHICSTVTFLGILLESGGLSINLPVIMMCVL